MTNQSIQALQPSHGGNEERIGPPPIITREVAQNVLRLVDVGLSPGAGQPEPGQMCVEAAVCYALGLPHGDNPGCVAEPLRRLKIQLNDCAWSSPQVRARGLRRAALAQLGSKGALNERQFILRVIRVALCRVPAAFRAAAWLHANEEHQLALKSAADACERDPTQESFIAARNAAEKAYAGSRGNSAAAVYAAFASTSAAVGATYPGRIDDVTLLSAASAAVWAADAAAAVAPYFDSARDADAIARDKALAELTEDVVHVLIEMNAPGCQWLDLTEPVNAGGNPLAA